MSARPVSINSSYYGATQSNRIVGNAAPPPAVYYQRPLDPPYNYAGPQERLSHSINFRESDQRNSIYSTVPRSTYNSTRSNDQYYNFVDQGRSAQSTYTRPSYNPQVSGERRSYVQSSQMMDIPNYSYYDGSLQSALMEGSRAKEVEMMNQSKLSQLKTEKNRLSREVHKQNKREASLIFGPGMKKVTHHVIHQEMREGGLSLEEENTELRRRIAFLEDVRVNELLSENQRLSDICSQLRSDNNSVQRELTEIRSSVNINSHSQLGRGEGGQREFRVERSAYDSEQRGDAMVSRSEFEVKQKELIEVKRKLAAAILERQKFEAKAAEASLLQSRIDQLTQESDRMRSMLSEQTKRANKAENEANSLRGSRPQPVFVDSVSSKEMQSILHSQLTEKGQMDEEIARLNRELAYARSSIKELQAYKDSHLLHSHPFELSTPASDDSKRMLELTNTKLSQKMEEIATLQEELSKQRAANSDLSNKIMDETHSLTIAHTTEMRRTKEKMDLLRLEVEDLRQQAVFLKAENQKLRETIEGRNSRTNRIDIVRTGPSTNLETRVTVPPRTVYATPNEEMVTIHHDQKLRTPSLGVSESHEVGFGPAAASSQSYSQPSSVSAPGISFRNGQVRDYREQYIYKDQALGSESQFPQRYINDYFIDDPTASSGQNSRKPSGANFFEQKP